MKQRNIIKSLNAAVEGVIYVLRTQRNMRLHFLTAILVLIIGIYLNLPKVELLLLLGAITMVLVLEMVNTAAELTIDLVKETYHPIARIIKDIAAGAVFLAAFNAAIVGYMVFAWRFALTAEAGIDRIIHSPWHMTFLALLLVLFLVVCIKSFFHKGTPFMGGMPSGHAAFVFSLWTIMVFITRSTLVTALSFIMAFIISRQRLKDRVHSLWEVIAGAILGILITTLVFQLVI